MPKKKGSKRNDVKTKRVRVSLNPLREQLATLVNQANARVTALAESGTPSRAVEEARRSKSRLTSRDKEEDLFRANLKTRRDINREFSRVQTFLNDFTSTVTGAQNFNKDLALESSLKGQFGGKWEASTGKRYNTDVIDDEKAAKAFEIYRKVMEESGGWDRAVGMMKGYEGLLGYGSENLIIQIYDMVVQNQWEGNILKTAKDMVESGIKAYEEMKINMVSNYDYGKIDTGRNYRRTLVHRRK